MDSDPWTIVFLNGKQVGITPIFEISLAAGKYYVVLRNPDKDITHSFKITIRPNETLRKMLNLYDKIK